MLKRIVNMFVRPYDEWGVILNEPATVRGMMFPYAVVLSGVVPLVSAVFELASFKPTADFSWPQGILAIVIGIGLAWGLSLLMAIVLAFVIGQVSDRFGGKGDTVQAYKVAVYSLTITWLSGLASFIPFVGGIVGFALAIYGLYVLYLGLHRLMRIPAAQRLITTFCVLLGQFLLMVAASFVTFFVAGLIINLFSAA